MWKVSVFGFILVYIFSHSDWVQRDFTQWKMEKLDSDWQKEDENDLVKEWHWQEIDRKSDSIDKSKFKTREKIERLREANDEDIE